MPTFMSAVVASILAQLLTVSALDVRVTPCGDNGFRVQVLPVASSLPPAVTEAWRTLNKSLASEGLSELPGAFLPACEVSSKKTTGLTATTAASATQGNLKAEISATGQLTFTRVDTGSVYATVTPTLAASPPIEASCAVGDYSAGSDLRKANLTLAAAAAWCAANASCVGYTTRTSGPHDACDSDAPTDAAAPAAASAVREIYFKGAGAVIGEDPAWRRWTKPLAGYLRAGLGLAAGDKDEKIYGLGQAGWTKSGGCPSGEQKVVPLVRNGQTLDLLQTKFDVAIPVAFSSAGYAFLFHMPGYGSVSVGGLGTGGMQWNASAALFLDFWVGGVPKGAGPGMAPLFTQYAQATGFAPPLRDEAMLFWQSRNRYKSSKIAISIAERYAKLKLPVGVLVVDYKNMHRDGDFLPAPDCYPSLPNLTATVHSLLNALTVFSFWPEVKEDALEYTLLKTEGCLINADLGGFAIDATKKACRSLIWDNLLLPRYYQQGVSAYWLDETDGEGTAGGYDAFSGGYATHFGPKAFASNLWVNEWLKIYTEPVAALGVHSPLALTRGAWAGGQRHGIVLWSSDIQSNFETLAAMVPQGVHASMSGIPWWTTDVGGYGCNYNQPNDSPYMRELIVRWYQFGLFCPVFRTHGCRQGPSEPDEAPCVPKQSSCGFNEVWSYGEETQALLERYVRVRGTTLLPYIRELAANVTAHGVPTMRPLAYEFPHDAGAALVNDQYLLGPSLLVAPVTAQNATSRSVYFPCAPFQNTSWVSFWDASIVEPCGTAARPVSAPLDTIPVYKRVEGRSEM